MISARRVFHRLGLDAIDRQWIHTLFGPPNYCRSNTSRCIHYPEFGTLVLQSLVAGFMTIVGITLVVSALSLNSLSLKMRAIKRLGDARAGFALWLMSSL